MQEQQVFLIIDLSIQPLNLLFKINHLSLLPHTERTDFYILFTAVLLSVDMDVPYCWSMIDQSSSVSPISDLMISQRQVLTLAQ